MLLYFSRRSLPSGRRQPGAGLSLCGRHHQSGQFDAAALQAVGPSGNDFAVR